MPSRMTMLNLTKTKNSSAKRRVMNGLVIETVESVVTGPVLMISLHESPALAAVDDAAPLVEWALKVLGPILEFQRRFLSQ